MTPSGVRPPAAIAFEALLAGAHVQLGRITVAIRDNRLCIVCRQYAPGENWRDPAAGETVYLGSHGLSMDWFLAEAAKLSREDLLGLVFTTVMREVADERIARREPPATPSPVTLEDQVRCSYCGGGHAVTYCPRTWAGQRAVLHRRCTYCGSRTHTWDWCPKTWAGSANLAWRPRDNPHGSSEPKW